VINIIKIIIDKSKKHESYDNILYNEGNTEEEWKQNEVFNI